MTLLIQCTSRHFEVVLVCPYVKCMNGPGCDVKESNLTLCLMLRKHVKGMSCMMELMNDECSVSNLFESSRSP